MNEYVTIQVTYMYDLEGTATDGTKVIIHGTFETGK